MAKERSISPGATIDERMTLPVRSGMRYGLKNGQGEYIAICQDSGSYKLPDGRWVNRNSKFAARWLVTISMDDIIAALLSRDPSWRVVRLLDYRYN